MEVTGTTMATDGEAKGKVTCKVIVGKYFTDTASYWTMGCVVFWIGLVRIGFDLMRLY